MIAAALGLAIQDAEPRPVAAAAWQCEVAVLVDDKLTCDDLAPTVVGDVCGERTGNARPIPPIVGGDRIDVARLCAQADPRPGGPGWGRMEPRALARLEQPVILDEATPDELTSLPRVGPVLAQRIAQGRPFASIDALIGVRGIGPKTLAGLRSRVRLTR